MLQLTKYLIRCLVKDEADSHQGKDFVRESIQVIEALLQFIIVVVCVAE